MSLTRTISSQIIDTQEIYTSRRYMGIIDKSKRVISDSKHRLYKLAYRSMIYTKAIKFSKNILFRIFRVEKKILKSVLLFFEVQVWPIKSSSEFLGASNYLLHSQVLDRLLLESRPVFLGLLLRDQFRHLFNPVCVLCADYLLGFFLQSSLSLHKLFLFLLLVYSYSSDILGKYKIPKSCLLL